MLRDRSADLYQHDRKHGYYQRGKMPKANPLEGMSMREILTTGYKDFKTEYAKWVKECPTWGSMFEMQLVHSHVREGTKMEKLLRSGLFGS